MSFGNHRKKLRKPTKTEIAEAVAGALHRQLSGEPSKAKAVARAIDCSVRTAEYILAGMQAASSPNLIALAIAFSDVRAVVNEMMGQGQAPAEERLEQIKALLLGQGR